MFSPDELIHHASGEALRPLVDLLSGQLADARVSLPPARPSNANEFAAWYLAAVQELEQVAARSLNRPPMTRREVELMCRCATSAGSLREAIELVVDYCNMLYPRAGLPTLQREGDRAVFSLDSLRGELTSITGIVDITGLHAFYQLFCWLTGQRIEILEIGCSRQRQEELKPFLVLFNATSMASTANYSFSFAAALLESSLVRNRSELDEFLRVYPCSIFGNFDYSGTGTQVRAFLDAALQQGSPIPSLGQLALVMHMSEITLRRRLRQEGNSYRELRDACLTEAAQHRLVQGDVSIDKISEALGFSDATAFRRSFKRCTGLSPSAWLDFRGQFA